MYIRNASTNYYVFNVRSITCFSVCKNKHLGELKEHEKSNLKLP